MAFDKEYPDGPPKPPPKPVKKVSTRPPSAYNVFVKQRLPIIKAEKGVRSLEACHARSFVSFEPAAMRSSAYNIFVKPCLPLIKAEKRVRYYMVPCACSITSHLQQLQRPAPTTSS